MRRIRISVAFCVGLACLLPSPTLAGPEAEVRLTLKDHRFVPAEVHAAQNTRIRLVVTNTDSTVEEFESPALNREKLIPPGQTVTIFLRPLKPGVYGFFGEFNPTTATGRLIVE